MEKITLKDKVFRLYIPNEEIEAAIDKVAEKINNDFNGCEDVPIVLCVLNGSIIFTGELMKRLTFPTNLISIKMKSYEGLSTTGKVKTAMGLTGDISGRRVIVVEDIIDSGYTMECLKGILKEKGATESYVCTMLFKPDALKVKDLKIDYIGMSIPNDFIVGFGLDYDELGRNYKDIYVLDK